jgi:hypothetical protein
MENEKKLSEQESLALITSMIQRTKSSYHDSGRSLLLWGSVVTIASFTSYLQQTFNFSIGFDIWLILFLAIIPQIFISIKERKQRQFKSHIDIAVDAVWLTYAVTLFGLTLYQNIIPELTAGLAKEEGWMVMKHFIDNSKPDEVLSPFIPSLFSIYLLAFAFPTLVIGIVKKFPAMLAGAIVTYLLFVVSCFTPFKYDMLFGAVTAIVCWFIPGIILRKRYNRQKANV